eukprot:4776858-Prymnesium_polylepis.1
MAFSVKNVDLSMTIDEYTEEEDTSFDRMLENCGVCDDCGDPDNGYCYCTTLDFDPEYANDEERKILEDYWEENMEYSDARDHRNKLRKTRKLLLKLKNHVICRNVGFYWLGKTVQRACADGGATRQADKGRAWAASGPEARGTWRQSNASLTVRAWYDKLAGVWRTRVDILGVFTPSSPPLPASPPAA